MKRFLPFFLVSICLVSPANSSSEECELKDKTHSVFCFFSMEESEPVLKETPKLDPIKPTPKCGEEDYDAWNEEISHSSSLQATEPPLKEGSTEDLKKPESLNDSKVKAVGSHSAEFIVTHPSLERPKKHTTRVFLMDGDETPEESPDNSDSEENEFTKKFSFEPIKPSFLGSKQSNASPIQKSLYDDSSDDSSDIANSSASDMIIGSVRTYQKMSLSNLHTEKGSSPLRLTSGSNSLSSADTNNTKKVYGKPKKHLTFDPAIKK